MAKQEAAVKSTATPPAAVPETPAASKAEQTDGQMMERLLRWQAGMTANTKPRNPRTPAEWQEAADAAQVLLTIDAARQYGLIEGGPECNQERCVEILRLAKRRGITPREDCVERAFRPTE